MLATPRSGKEPAPAGGNNETSIPMVDSALIVYYFDMGKDCSTCLNLETYTHETLRTHFSDKLALGEIRWEVVDVDSPANAHFVEGFGLYTKSVVLARMKDGEVGEFDNLSRIWELVYDRDAYMTYVKAQIDTILGAAP